LASAGDSSEHLGEIREGDVFFNNFSSTILEKFFALWKKNPALRRNLDLELLALRSI